MLLGMNMDGRKIIMRLIDANKIEPHEQFEALGNGKYEFVLVAYMDDIDALQPVNAVPVVRCKDCKHRPIGTNRDDLEFPDDKCPCKCEDYWYSWKPSDDWFCGNGE